MSSKPKAGINHKEYGVTSLGLIVYAEEFLRALSIDPHAQPFTIKMTGGPAGDVAGNAMKILFRDYGSNARILSVSDGSGSAYDPEGLDQKELLRLVHAEKDIDAFDPGKLRGEGAFVRGVDTPENVKTRNTLHNWVQADLFLPCGGRPDTINMANWEQFLDSDGKPTARAVAEGANLFITQPARDKLQEKGLLIVHGSSANKTGVICSSYEILGGLVMDEEEFLAIKEDYVAQVLDILKVRARSEARLMLREYKACGGCKSLTTISMELSREINMLTDRFYQVLEQEQPDVDQDPDLWQLFKDYCPPVMVDKYADRFITRVPRRHQYALIAAYAASRAVYAEGVGWMGRLATVRNLQDVVRAYLRQGKRLSDYAAEVRASGISDAEEVARILELAGRKLLTNEALELE